MSQWQKWVFATDLHGDRQHPPTVSRFLRFVEDYRPEIIVFGGDLFDLRPLRRGCSPEERRESMRADIDSGLGFLRQLFDRPAKQRHYLRGNHCERLWEAQHDTSGPVADLASLGVRDIEGQCRKLGVKLKPYHKRKGILQIGHLKMAHGYYSGTYAARQHAMTYGSILFGHVHIIDEHPVPGLERRVARAVGCLCHLDMDYNARQPNTLRQANGWAYGVVHSRSGNYFSQQAEEIGGDWNIDHL